MGYVMQEKKARKANSVTTFIKSIKKHIKTAKWPLTSKGAHPALRLRTCHRQKCGFNCGIPKGGGSRRCLATY